MVCERIRVVLTALPVHLPQHSTAQHSTVQLSQLMMEDRQPVVYQQWQPGECTSSVYQQWPAPSIRLLWHACLQHAFSSKQQQSPRRTSKGRCKCQAMISTGAGLLRSTEIAATWSPHPSNAANSPTYQLLINTPTKQPTDRRTDNITMLVCSLQRVKSLSTPVCECITTLSALVDVQEDLVMSSSGFSNQQ